MIGRVRPLDLVIKPVSLEEFEVLFAASGFDKGVRIGGCLGNSCQLGPWVATIIFICLVVVIFRGGNWLY